MIIQILMLALVLICPCVDCAAKALKQPVEFVVLIPSYNNEKWCIDNLESVLCQVYPHFSICYINDCSTDKTGELVSNYVRLHNLENKCTVIHNPVRKGALANLYEAIHKIAPSKVVVTVDGDDYLSNQHVLDILAAEYADKDVWMTYGNYFSIPCKWGVCCERIPSVVSKNNSFRSYRWVSSHLRTFYAKLFQLIKKEDLMWEGKFFPMTWDMAFLFPMLEMSRKKHFRFIQKPLYLYNVTNPINDGKVDTGLQQRLEREIRQRPPYAALKTLF